MLALGRDGWLLTLAFCAMGAGTTLLAASLPLVLARAKGVEALLAITGPLDFVSAAFHTGSTTHATPVHGTIHQPAGIASFLLFIAAMFVIAKRSRRTPIWRLAAPFSLACGPVSLLAFLLIPAVGTAHFGLVQRIAAGVWILWSLTLGAQMYRIAARNSAAITAARVNPEPA